MAMGNAPANSPIVDLNGLVHYDAKIKEFVKGSYRTAADQDTIDANKVDKVVGKGLSTNDYDNAAKQKVEAIPVNPQYTDTVYDDAGVKNDISTIKSTLSGKAEKTELPSKVSQLANDSKFITNTANDLANYYKKDETYTQAEINQLVSAIPKFGIQVVEALPTKDISPTVIYLVAKGDEEQNIYEEFIFTNGSWEKLGTQSTNLQGYAKESWVESKGYLTQHQDISGKVDKVAGKSLIADDEIKRLASIKNYDDAGIKADLNSRVDNAEIDKLFE